MSLKDLLVNRFSEEKLNAVPKHFEVIGDIAIITIPPSLENEKYIIAEALKSHRKDVKVVLRKINKLAGTWRVGDFEMLVGDRTTTLHRENGCIFLLDIARTYFSGKLYFERNRIVNLIKDGENILVLFCGVGPFLIPVAKKKKVNIVGIDNNPYACSLFRENSELNKVYADIIFGDAGSAGNLFKKSFDRIIMPTPYGQDHFLTIAGQLLKKESILHFYTFKKDFEINHFKRVLEERGWKIDFYRNCGDVAPRVNRYVFDLQLKQDII